MTHREVRADVLRRKKVSNLLPEWIDPRNAPIHLIMCAAFAAQDTGRGIEETNTERVNHSKRLDDVKHGLELMHVTHATREDLDQAAKGTRIKFDWTRANIEFRPAISYRHEYRQEISDVMRRAAIIASRRNQSNSR